MMEKFSLTEVHKMGAGVYHREDHDGPSTELVEFKVLVHWKEEGKSCGAKPRQPSAHHQYDDYSGVEVQALATPTCYCDLHTLYITSITSMSSGSTYNGNTVPTLTVQVTYT